MSGITCITLILWLKNYSYRCSQPLNPHKYLWVGKTNKLDFDECVSMHKCQHKSVSGITSEIFIMSSFSSKCTLWGLQIHYKRITAPNLEENTNVGVLSNDFKYIIKMPQSGEGSMQGKNTRNLPSAPCASSMNK